MRIVVIGTSGAGKTTLARALAARLNLPCIELDAINWQPGWHDIARHDPMEFARRVIDATQGEAWVADGNYSQLRHHLWRRATHLVWLDYDRPVIMARVIARSIQRAITRRELWPGTGNREDWRTWFRPSHPIRWAWSTWAGRRAMTERQLADPDLAHLTVLRFRRPNDASGAIEALAAACGAASDDGTIAAPVRSPIGGAP
jgi:adenylate kinase family enzyme